LSLPGLTRQSIPFELKRFFSMDARVKPGHDKRIDRSLSPRHPRA
jgi:hypothetical protein